MFLRLQLFRALNRQCIVGKLLLITNLLPCPKLRVELLLPIKHPAEATPHLQASGRREGFAP